MASQIAIRGKLDRNLTSRIFSVEFLDKIDSEIEDLLATEWPTGKTSWYPKKLRQSMMNLNRLVCTCYPEYNVPWFHEKYCIEEATSLRGPAFYDSAMEPIREDVYQTLCSVVGGSRNVRENVFSQYYNFIDFEVWLDTSDINDGAVEKFRMLSNFLPISKI